MLAPLVITTPYVLLDSQQPEGTVPFPDSVDVPSQGFLMVILDGVGEDIMLSPDFMPQLQTWRTQASTMKIETGPLTLSATCISELMTGVPNAPIDGLRNFNLGHPGGEDGWTLAAADDRYSVGMVGSYVMGNLYGSYENIDFVDTFQGHGDYYFGDADTAIQLESWLESSSHNVIAAHFSGPDKVGHKWGIETDPYFEKMIHIDHQVVSLLEGVPEDWTVIVTADHGMTATGSHGSAEESTREVVALVTGPSIGVGVEVDAEQRDVPALMITSLGLDFPLQLNGKIPLEIHTMQPNEITTLEQWNWDAASQRHVFFQPGDKGLADETMPTWSSLEDGSFNMRGIDIFASLLVVILLFCITYYGVRTKGPLRSDEVKFLVPFVAAISLCVLSHAYLSFSAMIPRALGAASAVWLVASSLGRDIKPSFLVSFSIHSLRFWPILIILLWLLTGSLSQSVLLTLLVWVIAWSVASWTGHASNGFSTSPGMYLMLVVGALTVGSLRLWYALIPFYFVISGFLVSSIAKRRPNIPLAVVWLLLVAALSLVHRRLFGRHFMLDLIGMNSLSFGGGIVTLVLVAITALAFVWSEYENLDIRLISVCASWLILGVLLKSTGEFWLQQMSLVMTVGLYLLSLWLYRKEPKTSRLTFLGALSLHVTITWGIWAATTTVLLLSCLPNVLDKFKSSVKTISEGVPHPRFLVALAVLPWVIWILWWTLLGQVNGIQTCFEGICPHPRELDPGAVVVQGGYFGGGEQPSTLWMTLMVASPLLAASVALMFSIKNAGFPLQPYMLSQFLIVFGCLSLYAYSPIYPRLVFALTWNIIFALAQLVFAGIAVLLHNRINHFGFNQTPPLREHGFRVELGS